MKNLYKILLFLIIFNFSYNNVNAQTLESTSNTGYFYVGANLGYTNFWGDISPDNTFAKFKDKFSILREPKFAAGLIFGYQFSPIIGSRFNIVSGKTHSSNDIVSYNGSFTDLSGQLTIDLSNLFFENWQSKINVYVFGGIGVMLHKSNQIKKSVAFFPGGLGVKYALSDFIDLTFETTLHYSATDMLDSIDFDQKSAFYMMDGIRFTSFGLCYKFVNSGKSLKGDGLKIKNLVW